MTTSTITKAMLQQLAEAGVRQRLADLEKELALYHKVWPDVFISPTPPQLLKAVPKPGAASTNGHGGVAWPAVTFTKTTPKTPKASKATKAWTPQRRAAQARLMKKYRAAGLLKRDKHDDRLGKVRAYLKEHGESDVKALMTAAGYLKSSGLISAMDTGLKAGVFQRIGRARYALGPKA